MRSPQCPSLDTKASPGRDWWIRKDLPFASRSRSVRPLASRWFVSTFSGDRRSDTSVPSRGSGFNTPSTSAEDSANWRLQKTGNGVLNSGPKVRHLLRTLSPRHPLLRSENGGGAEGRDES
jgi:hypothetical protein